MSFLNLLFTRNGQNIFVHAKSDQMFIEVANSYCSKAALTSPEEVKFLFNNEELKINSPKTLAELRIKDGSKNDVVNIANVIGAS